MLRRLIRRSRWLAWLGQRRASHSPLECPRAHHAPSSGCARCDLPVATHLSQLVLLSPGPQTGRLGPGCPACVQQSAHRAGPVATQQQRMRNWYDNRRSAPAAAAAKHHSPTRTKSELQCITQTQHSSDMPRACAPAPPAAAQAAAERPPCRSSSRGQSRRPPSHPCARAGRPSHWRTA
jgi:hypothetical protein